MNVFYGSEEIYCNGNSIGYIRNNSIYIYIQDNDEINIKCSYVDAMINSGLIPYIKLNRNYICVIFDNRSIVKRISTKEYDYSSYVKRIIKRYSGEFYIEIHSNGKIKAVDDDVEILVGKQKGDEMKIKLDDIYNEFIKDAVIDFIREMDEPYAVAIEEDTITICVNEAMIDKIEELF